ncbi:MAG: HPF/RaiA family ribosome-associated protein [Caldilineaceae bacterium]|nr:HPF/RaiA family ribosome-associated protein [Caldilineaceae bacterium]MCB0095181.1 HPF/RaiA family ribosome-associated protein [Caldilineaceae bacterium]MCB0140840.1 HPF/RaiA family ribosome-associated protein [Caldilineaceae bacterium]
MTQQNFTFEFLNEIQQLPADAEDRMRQEAESRLQMLGQGRSDLIGAAVSLEPIAETQGKPYLYQARVVAYVRPENIAGVAKGDDPAGALKEALDAVERQVRAQRERLQERTRQAATLGSNERLYELTAHEIYETYAGDVMPDVWLERSRDEIAADLMREAKLNQGDAFYVADQLLVVAEELVDDPTAQRAN